MQKKNDIIQSSQIASSNPLNNPNERQISVETEENLEDEIEGDESIDLNTPLHGDGLLAQIVEESKNKRFRKVF